MSSCFQTISVVSVERLRGRGEPRSTRRGLVQPSLSDRQTGAGAQRVSGRMTKGKGKLAVLHEVLISPALMFAVNADVRPNMMLLAINIAVYLYTASLSVSISFIFVHKAVQVAMHKHYILQQYIVLVSDPAKRAKAGASTPNMQVVSHSCCWKQLVLPLMLETPNTQAQIVFVLLSFPMTLSIADSIPCCNTLCIHLAGVGQTGSLHSAASHIRF